MKQLKLQNKILYLKNNQSTKNKEYLQMTKNLSENKKNTNKNRYF